MACIIYRDKYRSSQSNGKDNHPHNDNKKTNSNIVIMICNFNFFVRIAHKGYHNVEQGWVKGSLVWFPL